MKKRCLLTYFLSFWCFMIAQGARAEGSSSSDFPLDKGTYWVYRGETKYVVPKEATSQEEKEKGIANEPKKETLTWKMEVTDTLERPGVFAALIKGGPWDLAWYEPGKERGTYVILGVGGLRYYLYSGEQAEKVWGQLQASAPGIIPHEIAEGELILDFPMAEGKVFGGEFVNLLRGRYCWVVEAEQKLSPKQFPGAKKFPEAKTYALSFRTAPDHQEVFFTSGVGIIAYSYAHHGTPSSTDLQLIEFVKGVPKAE